MGLASNINVYCAYKLCSLLVVSILTFLYVIIFVIHVSLFMFSTNLFDVYTMLVPQLALDAVEGLNSHLVLDLLNSALFSEDRFFLVRGKFVVIY